MTSLEVTLFGFPRFAPDGRPVEPGRRKDAALAAYLAMKGGESSRPTLLALLRPEDPPKAARNDLRGFSLSSLGHDVMRALIDAAFLPHQAVVALDAIVRTGFRRLFSHRDMLQWASTQALPRVDPKKRPALMLSMGVIGTACACVAVLLASAMPPMVAAFPWLTLWILSPLAAWLLDWKRPELRRSHVLPAADARFLREIARRTWRY